ncbi:MAG: monovalent cation:proton antiporter-2 (CPA2) family protein [Bacteroidia bacterium]
MEGEFLKQALVFLSAAVLCVPVAKKLGMGSVLGYLFAGVIIGPYLLGFVGHEGEDIMHAAEFGVVMMLFLIGLELNPRSLWEMRKSIGGMGLMQTGLTATLAGALGYFFMNWSHNQSLAVALGVALSSTAMVLQTLKEKGMHQTTGGKASFSVLLFQDILVIPILAFLPLLAFTPAAQQTIHEKHFWDELPTIIQTLIIIGSITTIGIGGKFIVIPILRIIAKTGLREMFTAASLLLVIAVSYLMQVVGLSPALGAFLAGVVLANSEYRHELETDLEPFKGLLLGLFFVGVGVTMNIQLIFSEPILIFTFVFVLIILKALVLSLTGFVFGLKKDQNYLFSIILSQVGEFGFVIFSFSNQLNIIDKSTNDLLMAATALSMSITPLLLVVYERILMPYFGVKEIDTEKEADEIHTKHPVIIAGFGNFGATVCRFLRANNVESTVLEFDSDRVEMLRKMGFNVYYGDATRLDLLKSAGAETAKILVVAMDNPINNQTLIKTAKQHFPHLQIMARARNRNVAYDLIDMNIKYVYRETLQTSLQMAIDVLHKLGHRKYTATQKALEFIRYDEEALRKLARYRHNTKEYVINTRQEIELQEKLLKSDLNSRLKKANSSWGKH